MDKLKPCPFCGSGSVKYYNGWKYGDMAKDSGGFRIPSISCNFCTIGFNTGAYGRGVSDEIAEKNTKEAWNNRPSI